MLKWTTRMTLRKTLDGGIEMFKESIVLGIAFPFWKFLLMLDGPAGEPLVTGTLQEVSGP